MDAKHMKTSQSPYSETVTLPALNAQTSGLGTAAPWVSSASTGLLAIGGTIAFERSTVIWLTSTPQPFTVIWGCRPSACSSHLIRKSL